MKIFTYWHRGELPESYRISLENSKRLYDIEEYFESSFELVSKDNKDPRISSDEFRFKFLQKHPEYCYIDQDITIVKPIDFELVPDKVYIYNVEGDKTFTYGVGTLDVSAIIGNGCQKFFDDMLSLPNDFNELAWWRYGFDKFRNQIEFIPLGYFCHKKV